MFMVAKSKEFVKSILSSASPTTYEANAVKAASTLAFLTRFKDFPNTNVLFRAQDFSGYIENSIVNSISVQSSTLSSKASSLEDFVAPLNMDTFVDFISPLSAELTIIELVILDSAGTTYPKNAFRTNPLVSMSLPKNDLVLSTVNSKNLMRASFPTLVSSKNNNVLSTTPLSGNYILK